MNPLSEQDVRDFISKLSAESTKVLVVFSNAETGISFTLPGRLTLSLEGLITVLMEGPGAPFPSLGFSSFAVFTTSLSAILAAPRRGYADAREVFPRGVPAPPGFDGEVPIDFTLGFTFANGSLLVFTALRDTPPI
jgi:hypothetical protein